jgi:hypothetical protein
MADIGIDRPLVASRTEAAVGERFLSVPRAAAVAVFLLFAVTFDSGRIQDDGLVYYDFLRKFFGADVPAAAYQFGGSFWNAPFYLVSQLVAWVGGYPRYHAGAVGVTIASNAAVVATLYLGWRILKDLDLPRGPAVLLLTLFGTPLFFYGVVRPSYKHAADTLYASAAFFFLFRCTEPKARRRDLVAAGVCFALLVVTRYANLAPVLGAAAVLLVAGRTRTVRSIAAVAVVTAAVILALPTTRHIPYTTPPQLVNAPAVSPGDPPWLGAPAVRLASPPIVGPVTRNVRIEPLVPVYMLFTLHRGLFIWTPLTAFATAGFVLLVRRDRRHRLFLAAVGAWAIALLLVHVLWGSQWDGGGSFSQRFLTALFPFFLIGTAEFVRRARAVGTAALVLCVCWSLWIGLVQANGYYNESASDSVVQIAQNYTGHYHHGLGLWFHQIRVRITDRWQLYYRIVT